MVQTLNKIKLLLYLKYLSTCKNKQKVCEDKPCGLATPEQPIEQSQVQAPLLYNASLSTATLTCKPGWTHWINTETPSEEDPEDVEIIGDTTAVKV